MSQEVAKYLNHLEELLQQVKNRIPSALNINLAAAEINYDSIDNYITELNTYYYKSFHEHFFPYYQKTITQELEELFQIKQDQDMIIKDLLANLKRYAKLYNQVKIVNRLLADTREDFNSSLYTVYREKEQPGTELLYVFKSLHNALISLQNTINLLITLYEDPELLNAVRLYPNMARILVRTYKATPAELDMIRRLMVRLKAILKLLKQLQANDISKKIVTAILNEFALQVKAINSEKSWTTLPQPFIADFNFKIQNFTELISAYNELNKLDKIQSLAQEYENIISSFLIILDKGLDFLAQNYSRMAEDLLSNSFALIDLSRHSLLALNHNISAAKTTLDRIHDNIRQMGEPDFAYLAKIADNLLNDYQAKFQQFLQNEDLMQVPLLAKQLNMVNLECSLLDRELNSLKEKHDFSKLLEGKYLGLINILDSYLSFISNTRGDLERILAPRNLSRVWKGFNVKVERLPLEVGKIFPAPYAAILEEVKIDRQISTLDTNTILHEEGDIFIITIDHMSVYEIPPFTLAQKG